MIRIVKKENGLIWLYNFGRVESVLQPDASITLLDYNDGISILDDSGEKFDIVTSTVAATQVEPDAEIPFNGTTQDLIILLSENFFFMSNSGGGGSSSGSLSTGTPYLISNTDSTVYADGAQGTADPNGIDGLHFTNGANPSEKINWYYLNNANRSSAQTLTTLQGGYAVITIYAAGVCYFNVYTKRKNDGQDVSWYRSRITYLTYNAFDSFVGQKVVIYWGKEPTVYPDLPRIELTVDLASTVGPQQPDEEIFLSALNTSTNYPAATYSFTAESLGFIDNNIYHNFPCTFNSDVSALEQRVEDLETLSQFLIAADLGRYFRGYVMDAASMNALANPIDYNYVARVDTGTIWRYLSGAWTDTNITVSLESIGAMDAEVAGYSNTHYIDLDGTNDYVDLDTGVNTNVLDYTQSWALGIEVENVSSIQDSSYTTLFKRGNNEITLRKGGSNWGVYFYANGNTVAAANTWRQPEPGSKILFICNGTQVKYHLFRPSNGEIYQTNMTLNQTNVTNHNNASGNLEIGKGGVKGSNWYGGINNALIIEGASADLGANQKAEYFGGQDVTIMSFYEDIEDFLPLGEKTYPTVSGTKDVVSGNLINGTESDFVER